MAAIAALTTVIILNRTDRGFMTRECVKGSGVFGELRWDRADLPVPVHVRAEDLGWSDAVLAGLDTIDPEKKLFRWGGLIFHDAVLIDPIIVFEQDSGIEDGHGHETIRWTDECRIRSVEIRMPLVADHRGIARERAAAHELGHAVGLDHDDQETSVMYPSADPRFEYDLSGKDSELLKNAYF